jgi:ribosomal protein L22
MAWLPKVKTSPRKLNLVAKLVRRMGLEQALMQLRFCSKKMADVVSKTIHDAKWNAVNNNVRVSQNVVWNRCVCRFHCFLGANACLVQGWDASRLYIDEAIVGKNKWAPPYRMRTPLFLSTSSPLVLPSHAPTLRAGTSRASAITAGVALGA